MIVTFSRNLLSYTNKFKRHIGSKVYVVIGLSIIGGFLEAAGISLLGPVLNGFLNSEQADVETRWVGISLVDQTIHQTRARQSK